METMIETIRKNSELKENVRPTFYRTMKYWGKKPHNIWAHLIEKYTNINEIVYDPFAGSALTFFESVKINRKPIVIDINPMTYFLVDFYSKQYDENDIIKYFKNIYDEVKRLDIYKKNYIQKCKYCGNIVEVNNYRWENNELKNATYTCDVCNKIIFDEDVNEPYEEDLRLWKPSFKLDKLSSITKKTIDNFGGSEFINIYTKRNIELISVIFNEVLKIGDCNTKLALFFCFMKILHLTTKMNALRSTSTNRPLSTSWGRPAYMFLSDRMEQNPLLQFERALFDKNGILNSLKSGNLYFKNYTFTENIEKIEFYNGVALQADSKSINFSKMVDLVITDPPYGDIVQYGELSLIWNLWLNKYDSRFKIDLINEIVVNDKRNYLKFENDLLTVFDKCRSILKKDGHFIVTFHSDNVDDWNCIKSVLAKIDMELIDSYLQMNKRTGESNVNAKEGKTISDYYFILKK